MKKELLNKLILEIARLDEDSGDADADIKKAKKTVGDKLKNGKELTQPESEIAIGNADKDAKKKISSDLTSTTSITETEDDFNTPTKLELSNGEKIKVKGHPRAWIKTLRLGAVKAISLSDRIKQNIKDGTYPEDVNIEDKKKEIADLFTRAKARLNKAIEINSKYKLGYGGGNIRPLK